MKLAAISTKPPEGFNKEKTEKETEDLLTMMSEYQQVLYAQKKHSLLIVFQGMDTAGKDNVIKKVFSEISPLGCAAVGFKAPTEDENAHDFLWRIHKHTPAKGMIQIFDRSHYEDVLVPRVEGWVTNDIIKRRFAYINSFEKLLQDNNTTILKFFLHISKETQQERLEERKTNPKKLWKNDPNDMKVAKKWDSYMEAYEDIFTNCGADIPWTIVPSDHRWYKDYLVAKETCNALSAMKLSYPTSYIG